VLLGVDAKPSVTDLTGAGFTDEYRRVAGLERLAVLRGSYEQHHR
jgi:hypothetical protein